jgi:hypothetical protein
MAAQHSMSRCADGGFTPRFLPDALRQPLLHTRRQPSARIRATTLSCPGTTLPGRTTRCIPLRPAPSCRAATRSRGPPGTRVRVRSPRRDRPARAAVLPPERAPSRGTDPPVPRRAGVTVVVEQELHAGTLTRRFSRSAAKARQARTSSGVRSGKSETMSSTDIPDARYSRTS